jgi:hypothetical protein
MIHLSFCNILQHNNLGWVNMILLKLINNNDDFQVCFAIHQSE